MAVFTEQELMQTGAANATSILENAVFIESSAKMLTPKTVAVVENTAVQAHVVRFADVDALAEEYGVSYLDAMSAIVEQNGLDPEHFVVAVDEAEIITNPDVVNELTNVVVAPQSEKSLAYKFCEAMVDGFAETDEEAFLEAMVDDEVAASILDEADANRAADNIQRAKNWLTDKKNAVVNTAADAVDVATGNNRAGLTNRWLQGDKTAGKLMDVQHSVTKAKHAVANNKGKIGAGLAAAGLGALALKNKDKIAGAFSKGKEAASGFDGKAILKQAAGKDKNWIGKKVASLRSLYSKWLAKANAEKDAGRANAFKRVAASIMNVIDALLKKLEGSVGSK